jgi:hypothetical protein
MTGVMDDPNELNWCLFVI